MNKPNDPALGEAIQNYVRCKWRYREKWTHIGAEKMQLDSDLIERIDLLGVDDRQLIEVDAARVMSKLCELERAAEMEDGVSLVGDLPDSAEHEANEAIMEKMQLRETEKFGKIAKRDTVDDKAGEVHWGRQLQNLPDVEATVERIAGRLPWTHLVEFDNDGATERWLLRGHFPLTGLPD